MKVDLIVIGAGPAGLAAAIEAKKSGLENVLVIERDHEPGGILQQCIHNGFGLHYFGQELTGPEYAQKFIDEAKEIGITFLFDTMVLSLNSAKQAVIVNSTEGLVTYDAKAVILAMGCRERTRGALSIPGSRPSGVLTAGAAQYFVNREGYLPGKEIVILGSGDIGLIMARRLTLEGAKVKLVCELMPYPGGLTRNIVQCLHDFDIPLYLSTTVVNIHGMERLEGVTIAKVDDKQKPIPGSSQYIPCDTLLLSVGLIPENELSLDAGVAIDARTQGPIVDDARETTVSGIYACGNVVHVHDLADNVTKEAQIAGSNACEDMRLNHHDFSYIETKTGMGIRYIVPQKIRVKEHGNKVILYFRVDNIYKEKTVVLKADSRILMKKKKLKLTPGEMESIELSASDLNNMKQAKTVTISLE